MQSFTTLSLFLSLALASVSASPIQERDGTILCAAKPDYTRAISLNVKFPGQNGGVSFVEKYFGLEDGSNVLVSNSADGTNFTQDSVTKFDFYECKSKFLGTSNDGNFGVLKPSGDSSNCVQTQTGSVTTKDQVMVVAKCSTAENESQENQTFEFQGGFLNFTSTSRVANSEDHPTFFRLGENDQGALHLLAGHPRPPAFVPTDTGDYQGLSYLQ